MAEEFRQFFQSFNWDRNGFVTVDLNSESKLINRGSVLFCSDICWQSGQEYIGARFRSHFRIFCIDLDIKGWIVLSQPFNLLVEWLTLFGWVHNNKIESSSIKEWHKRFSICVGINRDSCLHFWFFYQVGHFKDSFSGELIISSWYIVIFESERFDPCLCKWCDPIFWYQILHMTIEFGVGFLADLIN